MNETRQKIIEKTSDLLELQGYHATGLNQIVKESQTPRGSLYYYFPDGKEELAAEAVRFKMTQLHSYTQSILNQHDDPSEAVFALIQGTTGSVMDEDCSRGAPIAAVALEASNSSERIRAACAAGYRALEDLLAEKLVKSGFAAERAARLAVLILAAVEGAMILSRSEKDSRAILAVAEELRQLLAHSPRA